MYGNWRGEVHAARHKQVDEIASTLIGTVAHTPGVDIVGHTSHVATLKPQTVKSLPMGVSNANH